MRSYLSGAAAATDCGQLGAADRMLTRSWDGDRGNLDSIVSRIFRGQHEFYLFEYLWCIELSLSNCA